MLLRRLPAGKISLPIASQKKKKKKKVGIINDGKEIKERQEQEVMESLLDGSQETRLS